jgi:hypothetical protein
MSDWIDLAALLTSFGALLATRQALKNDDIGRRLAVRPYISLRRQVFGNEGKVSFHIKSVGAGPAVVSEYRVLFDSEPIKLDDNADAASLSRRIGYPFVNPYVLDRMAPGSVLGVGDELRVLEFTFVGKDVPVHQLAKRFELVVKYRSVYGDELYSLKARDGVY